MTNDPLSHTDAPGAPQRFRTVVLEHAGYGALHYDWLLEDAGAPAPHAALLWTGRCALEPAQWRAARAWDVQSAPPHRRVYLTYEGPIAGERGQVRQVAAGWFTVEQWSAGHIIIQLELTPVLRGRVELKLDKKAVGWRAALCD